MSHKKIDFELCRDRASELSIAFLTHILNGITAPLFVKDREYRWVFCNNAFCNLLGRSNSELLGKSDTEVFSQAETERWRSQEERVFSTGIANSNDESITDADGKIYAISTQRTRIELETGQMFIVGTIQRLDRCHRVETCLSQSQQILQQILDSLPQSIFWKDRNSVYWGCNHNFARDAGLSSPREIIGKTDYDLPWTKEESDFSRECDKQVMDANQPQLHIVKTQHQANGRQIWLDISKVPLQDATGKAIGILGTYEDITERKQTEIALQQLNEDLETRVKKRTNTLRHLVGQLRREVQERQKAEAEQQKFVALVENSRDFIGISTLDGRVLYINEAGRQLFGVGDLESATGVSILEYIFPDDREWLVQNVLPVVMQQGNWQGQCRFRHFETEEAIPIEENIFVVKDVETGKPLCLATIGRDIRERLQAEARSHEQEQFFRTVYNGVEYLISTIDVSQDGEFRYAGWNDPTARATGVSNADATGKTPIEVFGEEAGAAITQHYRDCYQAKTAISYEENLVFHDESTWWMTTLTPLYSANGNIDRLIGTTFDITEQKRTEALLGEQVRLAAFRADVDMAITRGNSLSEMLTYCTDAAVKHLEAAFARIWTIDADELVLVLQASSGLYTHTNGNHARIPVGQFKIGQIAAECRPHLSNNVLEDPRLGDKEWARREGMVAFAGFPLIFEGQLLGVFALFARRPLSNLTLESLEFVSTEISLGMKRKATEEKLAQKTRDLEQTLQQLQRTQIQLLQSEKMSSLGQLVAGVAHEINNPVSFIYGNLTHVRDYTQDLLGLIERYRESYPDPLPNVRSEIESLDLDFLREDLPKTIESMQVGADRIKNIVLSLRNFSRTDEAALKKVDLKEGIDSTLLILKNRLKATVNRPEIEMVLSLENLPQIECYAGQLNQVLINLLSNAIDAIEFRHAQWETELQNSDDREIAVPYRGKIQIDTAMVDNNWVSIQITDNGVGIPETARPHIFDPFFTTKPIGKGTGMGLSICYQIIVDRHGGTLECTSELGRSTKFIIRIPKQQISYG